MALFSASSVILPQYIRTDLKEKVMSNYPTQDQPSWSGRSSRDEQLGRSSRDPYRNQEPGGQEFGGGQRRQWQQEAGRHEGSYSDAPYNERDFYEQNSMNSNYGAQRGGRMQHRNEPWPRNEDRENYSAAGAYTSSSDYGRSDYPDSGQPATGRYHSGGGRDSGQSNRGYGQTYGGVGANYSQQMQPPQMQEPAYWQNNRTQPQPFRGYRGDVFSQGDYGTPPSQYGYGLQRNIPQPGYFQAGDFSQRGGYTRSEYPEDSSYLYGHPHLHDNQQAGRSLGTQNWQEREGAQRGAFGLQSSHRGRGPQGYTRSDERIKEDICERLSEHHYIDASQIQVEVNQGVVTLEGSVDDRWQKYQTEDLADATSGVKDIQNRLNVSRASRQSAQWTSQSAAPQTASPQQNPQQNPQQQSATDAGMGKRPSGDKAGDAMRGKPGTTTN